MTEEKQNLIPVYTLDMLRIYFGVEPTTGKWFASIQTLTGKDRTRTEHDNAEAAMKRIWDYLWAHAQKVELRHVNTGDGGDRLVDVEADPSLIERGGA